MKPLSATQMSTTGDFRDKVAIITGASSGIGAATSVAFAREGANLCLVARNLERLKKVEKDCKAVCPVKVDLVEFDQLSSIVDKTIEAFGRLDVLVNNAAACEAMGKTVTIEDYETIMNTNLRAPYFISQYAIPHLEKTKGNVINVSSIVSTRPSLAQSIYSISKAGLDHLTRCLSGECSPKGVRVNCINPAFVSTPMAEQVLTDKDIGEQALAKLNNAQLLGIISPDYVARIILFLTSSGGQYVTGSTMEISGGYNEW